MNKSKNRCIACNCKTQQINDFGKMPLANGFIDRKNFKDEYFFNLKTSVCLECKLFQLNQQPEAKLMFNSTYPFYSSLSKNMKSHFSNFFQDIYKKHLINFPNSFSIEIGCNDGIFLENFTQNNLSHLGIEPSANVAEIAESKSINLTKKFIDKKLSNDIIQKYGQAHLIYAANVICHIQDINLLLSCINILLHDEGLFIFEDPYIGNVIKNNLFDQIYDEHVFLFSLISVKNILKNYNLEIIDCEETITHGGSMRYTIAKSGKYKVKNNVKNGILKENSLGLNNIETYLKFNENCKLFKKNFINLLENLKKNKKITIGYAATSKSTTILNYCNIDQNLISYIVDSTIIKQGKYSPGMHIPIVSDKEFRKENSDYCVLFAYNHMNEILTKEKNNNSKSKWINLFPQPMILND